ncbi:MAG: hypothetical protein PHC83_04120 [Bacteroidales bacterium]|nr:hypothetical protein [Bacteroidales bacterium]
MNQTYKAINLQYAVPPSLPIWGDLEGLSVDPLQFKYPELTPFQYASNRPITFTDVDGGEADLLKYLNQNINKTDPQGGLGVGYNLNQKYISIYKAKTEIQKNNIKRMDFPEQPQAIIKATPNTPYYSNEEYEKRQFSFNVNEFIEERKELDPFATELALYPVIQGVAVSYLTLGTGTPAYISFIARGTTNALTTAAIEKSFTGKINYISVASSFIFNKGNFLNYSTNAFISNNFNYNIKDGFTTSLNGTIPLDKALIETGSDIFFSFFGEGISSFHTDPLYKWTSTTGFDVLGEAIKQSGVEPCLIDEKQKP